MKRFIRYLALFTLCTCMASAQNPYGNTILNPSGTVMTATSQTSAAIPMGQSWSLCTITLTGTSLTTATFGVVASSDNGATYNATPPMWLVATPSTTATTMTATTNSVYQFLCGTFQYVKFVTSGTFTGTSINLLLTASPNAQANKSGSGGGGGGDTITSPNSTIAVGGTSTNTTLDVAPSKACMPAAPTALTDGATVTWAVGSSLCSNAQLDFLTHGGSRTLNVTGLVSGGNYTLVLTQDGTGGEGLILGTGCNAGWKVVDGGAGAVTLSTAANYVDILTFYYSGNLCYATVGRHYS